MWLASQRALLSCPCENCPSVQNSGVAELTPFPVLSTAPGTWSADHSALQSLNKMVPGKWPCGRGGGSYDKRVMWQLPPWSCLICSAVLAPRNHTFEEISSGSAVPTPHHARIGMGPRTRFSYHFEINLGCTHFYKYCTLGTEHSLQNNLTGYEPIAVGLRLFSWQ